MKVLLTCPYAWDDAGGVQVQVRELSRRLEASGHKILVLAPARAGANAPAAETWFHAAGRPVNIRYNSSNAPIDPRPWSRRAIATQIAGFRPDVIHAHEPLTPSTSMWATLEAGSVPVIATFHSAARRSLAFDIAAPLLRRVAGKLAARIAVSQAAARFVRQRIGGRFEVIPNGVDVSRFQSAVAADLGGGTKLLFVGRLDARKGFKTAVEAFRIAATSRQDLRLIVVGDGPQRGAVDTLPAPLRRRVAMLGAVPNSQIPAYYAACDLFLSPALGGESFGIVLVESMACGLPLVASDIPGYREVVTDRGQGRLIAPGDAAAFAGAIQEILGDPGLGARLANAGLVRAREFDWEVVVPRIEQVYRHVAG